MIGQTILNYKILTQIGEGGMGTVYLGTHITLDRKVAIKMLLPELSTSQQIKDRFINEAKTLSKLNHQNIVTLYDFASVDNNLFLIMEYVEGTSLDKVIENITGPIPESRCISIFDQILSGFSYAHKKGIIHRDIKPSNIILQADDAPKILDFGIAKIVEGDVRLTKTGTRMGSVVYMSPEQVMGREVDQRSDIYSLGVTLYEMLAGRLPYDTTTESEFEIQTKIVREPLEPVRSMNPMVSEELDQIICTATAKEPEYRFQSCETFKDQLKFNRLKTASSIPNKTVIEPIIPGNISRAQKTVMAIPIGINQPNLQDITSVKKSRITKTVIFGITAIATIVIILLILHSGNDNKVEVSKNVSNAPTTQQNVNKKNPMQIQEDELLVKQTILDWLNCWQSKEIECYKSYITYDYQYESEAAKNKYQDYNERLLVIQKHFKERAYINITATNISISITEQVAKVSYMQTYNSDKYNDSGLKVLYLRKENGKWKIFKDSFY